MSDKKGKATVGKKKIKGFLSKRNLIEAKGSALKYAEKYKITDVEKRLNNLDKRIKKHEAIWETHSVDRKQYLQEQADITAELEKCIRDLPEASILPEDIGKFKSKASFLKSSILILAVFKTIILGRLFNHWITGGFNIEEAQTTAFTMFAIVGGPFIRLILMYGKINQNKVKLKSNYLPKFNYDFACLAIVIYSFITFAFLEFKVLDFVSITTKTNWID